MAGADSGILPDNTEGAAAGREADSGRIITPTGREADGGRVITPAAVRRAQVAHERGLRAGAAGHPSAGARQLRAGLKALGWTEHRPANAVPLPEPYQAVAARLLISLAHLEAEQGRTELGLQLLHAATSITATADRGILLSQRGLLLLRTGRSAEALRYLDEAVPLLAGYADPAVLARVLLNRGATRLNLGQIKLARTDLEWCRRVAATAGTAPATGQSDGSGDTRLAMLAAKAAHNLGYCDVLTGDIPAALQLFSLAAATYRLSAPGNLPVLATDRARALLAVGLANEAAAELDSAIAAFRKQRLDQDLAEAELARSQAALAAAAPALASRWAATARRRFLRRGNEAYAGLARLTLLRARLATSGAPGLIASQSLVLADQLRTCGLRSDASMATLTAVRALVRGGRAAEAHRHLDTVRRTDPARSLEASLLGRLARAELAELDGRRGAMLAELRAGLSLLRARRGRLGSFDLQTGVAALGADIAAAGLRQAMDSGSAPLVFGWLERSRAQALRASPVRPPADPHAAEMLAELRQLSRLIRAAELNGRRDPAAIGRRAALLREIRQRSWETAGLAVDSASASTASGSTASGSTASAAKAPAGTGPAGTGPAATRPAGTGPAGTAPAGTAPAATRPAGTTPAGTGPASVGEVGEALAASGQTLAAILARDGRLHAVVLRDGHVRLIALGDYATAAEAARRLNADLDALAGPRLRAGFEAVIGESVRHQADVLTEEVIAPLRSELGDGGIVIVPAGLLAGVPWSVLPDLRSRPVTVCPSASSWLAAWRNERDGTEGSAQAGPPLVVAGPDLAHAAAEASAIANLHPGCRALVGDAATVQATLAGLDGAAFGHLATHGQHDQENFLFSRLELADGPLMAYDIQQLQRAPRQVILSACDVGRTVVRPGDEVLGFTAALLHIGTPTVIASVTRVADETAVRLMTSYHRALARGTRPARALADAARAEPFSPFVCFGAG
jgi:tetratricopeptide (TPR) repeat protein